MVLMAIHLDSAKLTWGGGGEGSNKERNVALSSAGITPMHFPFALEHPGGGDVCTVFVLKLFFSVPVAPLFGFGGTQVRTYRHRADGTNKSWR